MEPDKAGLDLAELSGDCSVEVIEAYLELWGVYARAERGDGLEPLVLDEGGLCRLYCLAELISSSRLVTTISPCLRPSRGLLANESW